MDIRLPAAKFKEQVDEEDEEQEVEEEIDDEEEEEENQREEIPGESGAETSESEAVVVSPRHSRAKSVTKVASEFFFNLKAYPKIPFISPGIIRQLRKGFWLASTKCCDRNHCCSQFS